MDENDLLGDDELLNDDLPTGEVKEAKSKSKPAPNIKTRRKRTPRPKSTTELNVIPSPVGLPAPVPENFNPEQYLQTHAKDNIDRMIDIAQNPLDLRAAFQSCRYLHEELTGRNRERVEQNTASNITLRQQISLTQAFLAACLKSQDQKQNLVIDVSGPQISEPNGDEPKQISQD